MNEPDPAQPGKTRISRKRFLTGAAVATGALGVTTAGVLLGHARSTDETPPASPTPSVRFPADRRVRIQHVLRGVGFPPGESEGQQGLDVGEQALLGELLTPPSQGDGLPPALRSLDTANLTPAELVSWWLGRMTSTHQPAVEKA